MSIPRSINATTKGVAIEFLAACLLPLPGKGGLIPLGANKRSAGKYKVPKEEARLGFLFCFVYLLLMISYVTCMTLCWHPFVVCD
jgi:hypothetical protein